MMRLYPKKLRNIEDLEREKKILRKQSRQLDKEEFLSMEGLLNNKKNKGKNDSNTGSIIDMLPISNPLVKMGLKLLQSRLTNKATSKKKEQATNTNAEAHKNKLRSLAFEFIGGYLKWKAIELSYKGIKLIVKKRRQQKSYEQQ